MPFCGVRAPKEDGSSPVDELLKLGVNSGKRCPMQTEKTVAVDGKKSESNRGQQWRRGSTKLPPRVFSVENFFGCLASEFMTMKEPATISQLEAEFLCGSGP